MPVKKVNAAESALSDKEITEDSKVLTAIHYMADNTEVSGQIKINGFDDLKSHLDRFKSSVKTKLVKDKDFVQASSDIKQCKDIEAGLEAFVQRIEESATDINIVRKYLKETADSIKSLRLGINKQLGDEKKIRKQKTIDAGKQECDGALKEANDSLYEIKGDFRAFFLQADNSPDLDLVIKGKSAQKAIEKAINTAVNEYKTELNNSIEDITHKVDMVNNVISSARDKHKDENGMKTYFSDFYNAQKLLDTSDSDLTVWIKDSMHEDSNRIERLLAKQAEEIERKRVADELLKKAEADAALASEEAEIIASAKEEVLTKPEPAVLEPYEMQSPASSFDQERPVEEETQAIQLKAEMTVNEKAFSSSEVMALVNKVFKQIMVDSELTPENMKSLVNSANKITVPQGIGIGRDGSRLVSEFNEKTEKLIGSSNNHTERAESSRERSESTQQENIERRHQKPEPFGGMVIS